MTEQNKQLLLKDLCARLPYEVKIEVKDWVILDTALKIGHIQRLQNDEIEVKPYLRPMSSMTEEEEKIFNDFLDFQAEYVSDADLNNKTDMYDWLLVNHFDFRGLIPMDLAIEAPANMYKTE